MTTPTITDYPGDIPAKGQSNTDFDTNVDAYLVWLSTLNIPELKILTPWIAGIRDEVAATALSGTLPSIAGKAGNWVRVNAGETAMEFRTPAEVASEIESLITFPPGVPAGGVLWFAADAAPTGYLKANGAAISRTTYSDLFAVVGTTFGAGDGSTTFEIPDLRAEFIRGWDDSRGVDAGRVFGSTQTDTFQDHGHTLTGRSHAAGSGTANEFSDTSQAETYSNTTSVQDAVEINGNGASRVGPETRPRNIALLACIKY